ncbi:zinc finger protein 676 [Neodiprion pinetum]|uniref:zinc finger protein 676 n=1 Tax=Neodiprion pinetum TaxID=441929 RepID=UPI001EDD2573|nr:zinc finger protein 345 [Neodiprion pinetum]XP_046469546.1 zinc finger protein 345 [Neodiprion pinetum]XP_046469547.1 zinc finger protein 345 [Neodiprion pinetum]
MNSNYFDLPLNLDRVCRVCLSESTNLSPLFCTDPEATELSGLYQKIEVCGSIEVQEEDGLPSLICDVCIYKATVAHEFRQQCQNSDARLRLYYNKPAKSNVTDSSTQTDPQTRIILTTKTTSSLGNYSVKQEMQTAGSQNFSTSGEPFPSTESCGPENKMREEIVEESKVFSICNIEFDGNKGDEKNEMLEDDTRHSPFPQTDLEDPGDLGTEPSLERIEEQKDAAELPDVKQDEPKSTELLEDDYLVESLLNDNAEGEDVPLIQRAQSRKVKSLPTKSYSDDECNVDYYNEANSDSQDSDSMKFKCKVCAKRYATQKGLKKHSLVHEKQHKCDICFKMFYKLENMEKHKTIHASKPHACQLCHASFSKSQSLVRHLKSHTEKVNDIIKQIKSDDPTEEKEPTNEFGIDNDTDDASETNDEPDEFENAPELYKCQACSQYCSSLKNLKRHSLVHGEKKYSCTVCKKWFFRPDSLKKHAEKHGHGLLDNLMYDNKLFDSDDEPIPKRKRKPATDNGESTRKEGSEEDGGGEYKCQHCDKIMATKKGLRRHVSMHKPKAEPATCEICEKVCASQARLALHQKTHNKPKEKVPREYLCHICSKVYPSNSSLTYHVRTHTGVKPHVCKICNSGFTTTTSLANHLRIHTGDKPFVCHVCSAAFAVSSAFRRHLTRHTGEANYLCKTCGKAFKRLSTLKEHTYTHSGEKPYICKTCGAAYSHSGSLFAHQKRCRAQYGEIGVLEDHHHTVAHHIHVNNVQSAVRSLAVIGQMF